MSFNFSELNLSGAEVQSGGSMLKPGKYIATVKEVKVTPTSKNDGSVKMDLVLEAANGGGTIKHWINLYNKTSAEATRIGRNELKTLLHFGGHPNPNQPGDVALIKNLTVGLLIKEAKYTKNGVEKTGSEVGAFIDPAEVDPERYTPRPLAAPPEKKGDGFADDIPF